MRQNGMRLGTRRDKSIITQQMAQLFNLTAVLTFFKALLFYHLIHIEDRQLLLYGTVTALISLLIAASAILFLARFRTAFLIVFYAFLSVFMFVDSVYYSYYNMFPSLSSLKQVSQIGPMTDSILQLITFRHWLLLVDIIPFIVVVVLLSGSNGKPHNRKWPFTAALILSLSLIVNLAVQLHVYKIRYFLPEELYTYHVLDFRDTVFVKPIPAVSCEDLPKENTNKGKELFGAAAGKNLVFVMVESLQRFAVGMTYEGQEITPNINSLLKDSICFNRFYQQVGKGNTSDAEFVMQTSLYPTTADSSYLRYADNDLYGLPAILKDQGYRTIAFHANEGDFWNRDKVYQTLGYERFVTSKDYKPGEQIGLGLADKDFFSQSVSFLESLEQPFYAFMITLSNHHPYRLDSAHRTLSLKPEHEGTLFGHYLQSVHYTDAAIGVLVDELKKAGLYDNTVLCIMGDHFGLSATDETNNRIMTQVLGYPYAYDEMMRVPFIIHIPGCGLNRKSDIAAGQIDVLPTLLNLFGIENPTLCFGQDLLNAAEGFVAQQTHMPRGSFIDDDKVFIMSRDGLFENSRAFSAETRSPVSLEACREGYERAIRETGQSRWLLENNQVMEIIEKGRREN